MSTTREASTSRVGALLVRYADWFVGVGVLGLMLTLITPLPPTGAQVLLPGDRIVAIMPAEAFLKFRSNVPQYAKVVFNCFNEEGSPTFAQRGLALKKEGGTL